MTRRYRHWSSDMVTMARDTWNHDAKYYIGSLGSYVASKLNEEFGTDFTGRDIYSLAPRVGGFMSRGRMKWPPEVVDRIRVLWNDIGMQSGQIAACVLVEFGYHVKPKDITDVVQRYDGFLPRRPRKK